MKPWFDELEAKLETAQTVQGRLLEAVVGQVVNAGQASKYLRH